MSCTCAFESIAHSTATILLRILFQFIMIRSLNPVAYLTVLRIAYFYPIYT